MPTTNPVPSQDPSDLLFNAGKLDEALNGTGTSFTDRLGVARRTVAGMNSDFDAQLADAESDLNVYRADAAASAAQALGYLNTIRTTSYGAYASDPATDPLGNPPTVGDEYFNTTANLLKRWNGTTWQASDINTANLAAPSGSSLVGYTPAGTGAVAKTVQSKLREFVSVKDFGAKGDGVTDDYAAIMAAINSFSGAASTYYVAGPTVYFPPGNYFCSQAINLKKTVRLIGETNGQGGAASVTLTFPSGSDGIIVNRYNTNGTSGTTTAGKGADGSIIEGLAVTQAGYALSAAPILDYNAGNSQFISNIVGAAFSVGNAIYVPNTLLVSKGGGTVSSVDTTSRVLDLAKSPSSFAIGETVTGGASGATGVVIYVGAQTKALGLKTVTGTFQANETITGGTSAATAKVSGVYSRALTVYTLTGITGTFAVRDVAIKPADYGTGIRLRARATVRKCNLSYWPNFGVAVIAGETGGTNANLSIVEDTSVGSVGLHGFVTDYGDANAGKFSGLNAVACGGYGYYDASFLGNHYYSCHVSDCGVGAYYSNESNNFSVFLGCYSEGMVQTQPFRVPRSSIGSLSTVIGGDHGAGFDSTDIHSAAGYSYLAGRDFRVGQGVKLTSGLDASGRINDTLKFQGLSGTPTPATVAANGLWSNLYGPYYGYRAPYANSASPLRADDGESVLAGKHGVVWASRGARFDLQLIPIKTGTIVPTGGSPSRSAVFYPIVSGGVITSLQICDAGEGYSSAPSLSGTGVWAGFTATTEVFNGQVVGYTITNGLTGLALTTPVSTLQIESTDMAPSADNAMTLGLSGQRWSVVYAATGTINTSDERTKQDISALDAAELRVAVAIKGLVKKFRFKDAVQAKGETARIHVGVIAQEVIGAFQAEGLDAMRYGILCYDEWDAELDENGNELRPAGNRYGVRYEELLAFIIAAL